MNRFPKGDFLFGENMTDNTNVTEENDVSGTNDNSEAAGNAGTDNSNTQENQEKKLTQSEVNDIVKRAKQDAERAAKTKFDKGLEGKHVLTDEELSARVKEAVDTAIKEVELNSVRQKIMSEYGLNEHQISKLEGSTEKELKEDAEKTYGKPKKSAPVLNGGADTNNDKQQSSGYAQKQQQKLADLRKKYHVK